MKLRNRKVLLANLPHMINLFAVDTFRGSFLRKIKIPDYIWYEYMNKSWLFYDVYENKLYAFRNPKLETQCDGSHLWACYERFIQEFWNHISFIPVFEAQTYNFISESVMLDFLEMMKRSMCWLRLISITNKVRYSWRISVCNISLEGQNQSCLYKNDALGVNVWAWSWCKSTEKTEDMIEVYQSGIWLNEYQAGDQIRAWLNSTINLWESIVKPTSFDTTFFGISKATKDYRQRDLSELLNNIYILYDYSVNQYWINNIYQFEQSKVKSNKSMFDNRSNMHLIVNRYDDWKIKLSGDLKSEAVDWVKDNRNLRRDYYFRVYSIISSLMWSFLDLKQYFSRNIIYLIHYAFKWSLSHSTDFRSHIKSDFYFRQFLDIFKSDHVQITKFTENHDAQYINESTISVSGNDIKLFEKPSAKLFINHVNIQRNFFVANELKMAVKQSQLEFALEPYIDCLDFPEINNYRNLGMLETTQTSIIIRHWSLILAFGMNRLIHDLHNDSLVPGFTLTNAEEYKVVQPRIKRLLFQHPNHKEEYRNIKSKLQSMEAKVYGLYKLYNSLIFLKYNAVRYFYHVNSFYRDQQDDVQIIDGTDQNIIYKEQIIEDEDTCYATQFNGRSFHKIIYGSSMLDLLLSLISLSYKVNANTNKLFWQRPSALPYANI